MAAEKKIHLLLVFIFLFGFTAPVFSVNHDSISATDTTKINKGRLTGVVLTEGSLYLASLTGLYFAWYKDYPQSSFHFFDDNNEWMQMDKIGHSTTAYYVSRIGYESYRWAGVDENKSTLFGGLFGFAYLLNIEILDGFSQGWGFSVGDFTANTSGCLLFMGQQWLWKEQRFVLKYSYHHTKYPAYRPNLLGTNLLQNTFKDYNGQSYWLSGNIHSFLPERSRFPRWLNIAVGYGAEGMTGANQNTENKGIPEFTRYRKFYLSLDVDLTKIRTRSKTLRSVFVVLNFIKIPFPALEYNTLGKFRFHPVYF